MRWCVFFWMGLFSRFAGMDVWLFISLLICHWMADFTHLSRPYMLAAKKFGKPLTPIFHHAFIHASLMVIPLSFFTTPAMGFNCFLIQIASHFCIDVLKGRLNGWYPSLQNPANYFHWYVFGADQFLHIMVIILMTFIASWTCAKVETGWDSTSFNPPSGIFSEWINT